MNPTARLTPNRRRLITAFALISSPFAAAASVAGSLPRMVALTSKRRRDSQTDNKRNER